MVRLLPLLFLVAVPVAAESVAPEDLAELPPADVVILGEVHDNAAHHVHQAQAVAAIRPRALVFEMLTPEQAGQAVGVDRSDAAALGAALGWAGTGWPDFALYHPIFAAAPDAVIFGDGMDRAQVRRAFSEPPEAIFGTEAADFGLLDVLDPADQAAREAEQQASHCNALPPEMLSGFVAAQRLRDAVLARAVRDAWVATGGPVVLIAGTEHARKDVGVPAKLARAAGLRVLSVGQVEGDPGADAPFDLWVVTEPAPRDDPCAGFNARRTAP